MKHRETGASCPGGCPLSEPRVIAIRRLRPQSKINTPNALSPVARSSRRVDFCRRMLQWRLAFDLVKYEPGN